VRTTLTLDKDVVAKLNAEMRRSGKSFKDVVNDFLRIGLNARRELKSSERFKVQARELGTTPGLDYDNIGELIEQIEGPRHK
jgi:hypothetical protein